MSMKSMSSFALLPHAALFLLAGVGLGLDGDGSDGAGTGTGTDANDGPTAASRQRGEMSPAREMSGTGGIEMSLNIFLSDERVGSVPPLLTHNGV